MSCDGLYVVTMGCSVNPLDVCFGYQLTDSRGDIAGNLCIGVDARFHIPFSGRNLGMLLKFLVLD